jgi:DNA ligase-1
LPADSRSLIVRAPVLHGNSSRHVAELFESARARGNEGLMIKDMASPYTPGRRGKSWLKLKRELATLDVVVTAVEYGNGKRARVLSDYTFAVRARDAAANNGLPQTPSGEPLLNIGKAYTGLTDAEIARMNEWFLQHTIEDNGWVRRVEPKVVIEVAFNAVMRSDRHNSGYALRFPRILRLRPDKSPDEADTLESLREIYDRQHTLPKSA